MESTVNAVQLKKYRSPHKLFHFYILCLVVWYRQLEQGEAGDIQIT